MPPTALRRVIVLGGGIGGLVAAYRRLERARQEGAPVDLKLVEASDRLGGTIHTTSVDGFLIDHGPDEFHSNPPHAIDLCRELGLEAELIPTKPQRWRNLIVRGNRFLPAPENLDFLASGSTGPLLRSPAMTWSGKLRLAMSPFAKKHKPTGDEPLGFFVRKRFGGDALQHVVEPMAGALHAADAERLSFEAIGPSSPSFSLRKGLESLVKALASRLPPESVLLKSKAWRVKREQKSGTWAVAFENRTPLVAEEIVLALPAHNAASVLWEQDRELATLIDQIEHAGVAILHFGLRREQIGRDLQAHEFSVPRMEHRGLLSCTFSQNKFEGRAPEHFALLRVLVGGSLHPEVLDLSDSTLSAQTFDELRRLLQITGEARMTLISRYPRSIPQYHLGHTTRIVQILERAQAHTGLRLIGGAYEGMGIAHCVRSARSI